MRSTFKVLFYVNGSKEKNGIVPIMGRVTINGSVAQFSCKLTIAKTMWDAKGNRAKGKSKESRDINLALDNIKAQIIKHYQRISDREAYVTAEMVRNAYQGIGTEYETLLGAFDKDNESFKKRIGIDRAASSYKVRVRSRNHLAAFIKKCYKRSDISMLEITPDFIKEYEIYLSTDPGLHNGSVWSLYVVEDNRVKGSLKWTDTEKSICSVSGKSEYQGATISYRRRNQGCNDSRVCR